MSKVSLGKPRREICGAFAMDKVPAAIFCRVEKRRWYKCQENRGDRVHIRDVLIWRTGGTVRSISRRSTAIMKSMAEIKLRRRDTAGHGRGFVISMHPSIHSVSCVLKVELSWRRKRFTTRSRWVKVARTIGAIWLRCASRVTHRSTRREAITGEDGTDRTHPGEIEISTGMAPKERRGGLVCKIAKLKVKIPMW